MNVKKADDILREACAELADEEASQLEQSLNRTAIREAEEAYRHHRPKALRLIQQHMPKRNRGRMLLPIAAALLIALGGALMALRKPASDSIEQTQLPSEISVQPFFTDPVLLSPTSILSSTTFVPSSTPIGAFIPTPIPLITATPTVIPTFSPLPTITPAQTATPAPTGTPVPSLAPTVPPAPASLVPPGWQGVHYPSLLPPGFELVSVTREEDCCTAAYHRYGQTLLFMEYDTTRLIEAPTDADYAYTQINGETALQVKTDEGVTLTWNQNGHTLSLFTPQGDGTDIAESVKKVTAE